MTDILTTLAVPAAYLLLVTGFVQVFDHALRGVIMMVAGAALVLAVLGGMPSVPVVASSVEPAATALNVGETIAVFFLWAVVGLL